MAKINLLEILKRYDTVELNLDAKDWKQAVHLSIKPLIEKGLVESKYYDAVIDSTLKHGPYYIICDKLAMPHAQSDAGVLSDCFSLITLKNPVYFDNDDRPVFILIALAATSPEIHTAEALPQIVAVFENSETIDAILKCKEKNEVYDIISKIDFQKYLNN